MPRKWKYHSPIGTLYIVELEDGTFGFKYKGTIWEACDTPEAQADDVFQHVTQCNDWDSLPPSSFDPSDLSEWEPLF